MLRGTSRVPMAGAADTRIGSFATGTVVTDGAGLKSSAGATEFGRCNS